jgi:hypothetical protein
MISTKTGYSLGSLEETSSGLSAKLSLAGEGCNAFGHDIANLTIQVTYDTTTRYASCTLFSDWCSHVLDFTSRFSTRITRNLQFQTPLFP